MAYRQSLSHFRSGLVSRLVHSSAPSRATALHATALPMEEPEEIVLRPIFDIFDAPSRLGESSKFVQEKMRARRPREVEAEVEPALNPSLPRPPPSTLPPPIIFDGPARPRNLSLAFQRRVDQALSSIPASTRHHHTPSASSHTPDLLVEMFEGPARVTRYSHRSSARQGKTGNQLLLLGLAGAVGGAALLTNDNFPILPSSPNSRR